MRLLTILIAITSLISALSLYIRTMVDPRPILDAFNDINNPDSSDIIRKYIGDDKSIKNLDGRVVIVAGGDFGVGLETARSLVEAGATVIIGSKSKETATAAADEINNNNKKKISSNGRAVLLDSPIQLNLASQVSIRAYANTFRRQYDRLDLLILCPSPLQHFFDRTEEGIPTTLGINHVGHFFLTKQLLPLLKMTASKSSDVSRVVIISGSSPFIFAKSITSLTLQELTNQDSSEIAYFRNPIRGAVEDAHIKLANVMFAKELAKRHPEIRAYSVNPGIVNPGLAIEKFQDRYNLTENFLAQFAAWLQFILYSLIPFKRSVKQAAAAVVFAAIAPELANESGKFYADFKESLAYPITQDETLCKHLWELSEHLVSKVSS